jgi:hypothetical protein
MIKSYSEFMNKSKALDLSKKISKAIYEVDESLSVDDFAKAVAEVFNDEYGKHIYDRFFNTLKSNIIK